MKKFFIITCMLLIFSPAYAEYVNVLDYLNVRAASDVNSVVIDKLERATFVVVEYNSGDWSYIKYVTNKQYKYGWVKSKYLSESFVYKNVIFTNYQREVEELKQRLKEEYRPIKEQKEKELDEAYQKCVANTKFIESCKSNRIFSTPILDDMDYKKFNLEKRLIDAKYGFDKFIPVPTDIINVRIVN